MRKATGSNPVLPTIQELSELSNNRVTLSFVIDFCDGGPIIIQKAVEIKNGDTPEVLQKRVMEQAEWKILPKAVSLFCEDKIIVKDNIAEIIE